MTIRVLSTPADLDAVVELQIRVWDMPAPEAVPTHLLVAAVHAGGLMAVFEDQDGPAGFVFGLAALVEGEPAHHSHMLGVLPHKRGGGIGAALKWFQRHWCLERGLRQVRWTFDPLQAGNAHLNLVKLGAIGIAYLEDAYGELTSRVNRGVPSDRLLVTWELESPRVVAAAGGVPPPPFGEEMVSVEIPSSFSDLLAENPADAKRLRLQVRRELEEYLEHGYRVTGFSRDPAPALLLSRAEGRT